MTKGAEERIITKGSLMPVLEHAGTHAPRLLFCSEAASIMPTRTFKHEQLTAHLRKLADSLQPGDRLPSQTDLMRQFSVSDRTVLRSLEDLRRAGWIVRRNGSGTYVNPRNLRHKMPMSGISTELVAVLAMAPTPTIFAEIVQAVEENLRTQGRAPLLVLDADPERRSRQARAHWDSHNVKGMIHVGSAVVPGLGNAPLVTIGETYPGGETRQVSIDNVGAGRLAGQHLWSLGHRRVAMIIPEDGDGIRRISGIAALRLQGIRGYWEEQGVLWQPQWTIFAPLPPRPTNGTEDQVPAMTQALRPVLNGPDAPTALFALHDEPAAVAVRAVETLGRRVPEDISVVGFNDAGLLAAHFRPALTTVRMPSALLGKMSVEMLQAMITKPAIQPPSRRIMPELIARESTGPAPH